MKNFKIDVFDEKKLATKWGKYSVKKIKEIKYNGSIESLILELDRTKEKEIKITQLFDDFEVIQDYSSIDSENNELLFIIREDGHVYDEKNGKYFINLSTTEKTDYRNFSMNIHINYLSEELYRKLETIGVKIVAFSGLYDEEGNEHDPEEVIRFSFIINKGDRNKFILACIRVIEYEYDMIHDKSVIEELKNKQIEEIIQLNKEQDRKGKLIDLKNKNNSKEFELILLLLHLEGKIYIRPGIVLNRIWKIDLIISEKTKGNKVYFFNHIEYNISSGVLLNTKNGARYTVVELHRLFLAILIKEEKNVPYNVIHEYFKSNIVKDDLPISSMNTIKGNLLGLLKDNNILKKGEIFIRGKNKGYIIDFSYS